ncbi:SRPBCC family protein [Actinotalea sp. AC32]|nr:SRPBCC family protein [Actinotalea sp. AC32]
MSTLRRTAVPVAAAVATAVVAAYPTARRRALEWGATPDETTAVLPGDSLVPRADLVATRATDVDVHPDHIWPWLAQIGQGKAGFYSYEALENLAGCDIHNADRVVGSWQDVAVGDEVHLHPDVALRVALVEPPDALVLHGGAPTDDDGPALFDFSWAFVVRPGRDEGHSRLVVRERYHYRAPWAGSVVEPVAWVSALMTERMLRGIRHRAEGVPA